jgi:hypothetical protein
LSAGQEAQREEAVAEEHAPDREQRDRERRMIDVAEVEMVRARQVVELVAEDPVARRRREVEGQTQTGDAREDPEVARLPPDRHVASGWGR